MTSEELIGKYPRILGKVGYVGVGDGWLPIIDKLCAAIEQRAIEDGLVPPYAMQIKEKFGGLRFYTYGNEVSHRDLITIAEVEAEKTCETCGKPGTLRTGGWLKTLCGEHSGGK